MQDNFQRIVNNLLSDAEVSQVAILMQIVNRRCIFMPANAAVPDPGLHRGCNLLVFLCL